MKRIKCPKCRKPVLKTIGCKVKGDSYYYINRERFGSIFFNYWHGIASSKRNILGFYCRHCGKPFPEEMRKKIFHWIKLIGILNKLTQT